MKKTQNLIAVILFCAVIVTMPVISALLPREHKSDYENRELATFPYLSVKTLFNGSFVAGVEDYLTDHIAGRNAMLATYVKINRDVLAKPVVNDVYESDEGTLIAKSNYDRYNETAVQEQMENKVSEIEALDALISSYGGEFIFCGVSEQRRGHYEELPDYLRPGTDTLDHAEQLLFDGLDAAGITAINMYDVFTEHGGQNAFYSDLDHHYTFDGACLTYETVMDTINASREEKLTVLRADDLVFHEEPGPFYGSYNRKIFNLQDVQEKLVWAEPKEPIAFTRTDNGEAVEATIFTPRDGNASYGSYMDGDIGETVIDTGRDDLPTVLIFGDSFTNPIEGLLYYSFDEMRALDLRHYTEMTLSQYIEQYQPDYVIALRDRGQYNQTAGNGTYR